LLVFPGDNADGKYISRFILVEVFESIFTAQLRMLMSGYKLFISVVVLKDI
jgi:hypothetical protein